MYQSALLRTYRFISASDTECLLSSEAIGVKDSPGGVLSAEVTEDVRQFTNGLVYDCLPYRVSMPNRPSVSTLESSLSKTSRQPAPNAAGHAEQQAIVMLVVALSRPITSLQKASSHKETLMRHILRLEPRYREIPYRIKARCRMLRRNHRSGGPRTSASPVSWAW